MKHCNVFIIEIWNKRLSTFHCYITCIIIDIINIVVVVVGFAVAAIVIMDGH